MASTIGRSVRRWGSVASASAHPQAGVGAFSVTKRNLSASIRLHNDEEKPSSSSSRSSNDQQNSPDSASSSSEITGYQPPQQSTRTWPFDSTPTDSAPSSSSDSSDASSSSANPYAGLFDGSDPFPKVKLPNLSGSNPSTTPFSSDPSPSNSGSWLSEKLDSLSSSSRTARASTSSRNPIRRDDERKKHLVPRSVLFADTDSSRQSDFLPRKPSSTGGSTRKKLDRTPLTQQEANAFMSLLNQALAGTSTPSPPSPRGALGGEKEQTPFGNYTSLISDPKTRSGSKSLLLAFQKRNRLKRFEEARAHRERRFGREGLAAEIDPLQLEAGIDEAREQIAMCENLAEVIDFAKKEVWGIGPIPPPTAEGEGEGPKYGKNTPFYSSVLQLIFVAIRDRYRAPQTALSIARVTRSLGIESYVLGVTGSLYNEVLKTQWDHLGDLHGVVSTLKQARETGILSAPTKRAPTAPPPGSIEGRKTWASTEDEAIRETVDRIANEVRKFVLDEQMSDPQFKRDYLYGTDVLGGNDGGERRVGGGDWSQKWLLAQAGEACALAGEPFRLWERKQRGGEFKTGDRGTRRSDSSDRYSGGSWDERKTIRPGMDGYKSRDGRSSPRYSSGSSSSYNSRPAPRGRSSSMSY